MIKIGRIYDIDKHCGEIWLIVRSPDEIPTNVKHIPLFAPSQELFQKYRVAFHNGTFDKTFFDNIYVPQFIKELIENKAAANMLNELKCKSFTHNYCLCCYCKDETLCHRSIIAGILFGMGAKIETKKEYIKYFNMFMELSK